MIFWSCHSGAGATGEAFVRSVAATTGTRVAAFSGKVGASELGGTWLPNIGPKTSEIQPPFATALHYRHVMANRGLVLQKTAVMQLEDTPQDDGFSQQGGKLMATDSSTNLFVQDYGIQDGLRDGNLISRDHDYGTLFVVKNSGQYFFRLKSTVINALDEGSYSAKFTVTATSAGRTDVEFLTMKITGANDRPILTAPSTMTLTDTDASDALAAISGTLQASDAEGDKLSYGLQFGSVMASRTSRQVKA